jgi:hypothetical protein
VLPKNPGAAVTNFHFPYQSAEAPQVQQSIVGEEPQQATPLVTIPFSGLGDREGLV